MQSQRGLFIVFEGLDRCGKSTQVQMLIDYLTKSNQETKLQQFPDRSTMLGGIISSYLKGTQELSDEVIHLLFAANRWEKKYSNQLQDYNELKQHLEAGRHVVCDRYSYSGVAFSSAKGLPYDWCKSSDIRLIRPDVVIYLQAPLGVLIQRGDYGLERYEKVEFQTKVKEQFDKMIMEYGFHVVQADQDQQKVHQDIVELVLARLGDARLELQTM